MKFLEHVQYYEINFFLLLLLQSLLNFLRVNFLKSSVLENPFAILITPKITQFNVHAYNLRSLYEALLGSNEREVNHNTIFSYVFDCFYTRTIFLVEQKFEPWNFTAIARLRRTVRVHNVYLYCNDLTRWPFLRPQVEHLNGSCGRMPASYTEQYNSENASRL